MNFLITSGSSGSDSSVVVVAIVVVDVVAILNFNLLFLAPSESFVINKSPVM